MNMRTQTGLLLLGTIASVILAIISSSPDGVLLGGIGACLLGLMAAVNLHFMITGWRESVRHRRALIASLPAEAERIRRLEEHDPNLKAMNEAFYADPPAWAIKLYRDDPEIAPAWFKAWDAKQPR